MNLAERTAAIAAQARAYREATGSTQEPEPAANDDAPKPSGDPPRDCWWVHRGEDCFAVHVNPPQTQGEMLAFYPGCGVTMLP